MGKSLKGKELGIGITQRKDGRYSAKFKSKSGKRVEKYFNKLPEARKWLSEAKYDDEHGNIAASADMTVDAWFEYWITEIKGKTVRKSTFDGYLDRYKKNIQNVIGNMIVNNVRPMHCQGIINIMDEQGYAGGSMEKTKMVLHEMFSDALENGIVSMNPVTKSVKCPKKRHGPARVLTLDEQEKFLTIAKESSYYYHFLFVLQTGIRSSELRGLKWSDVDFDNRLIRIRRNTTYDSHNGEFITGELKTSTSQRDIPLTQTSYDIIIHMKRIQEVKEKKVVIFDFLDHIFLNRNGKLICNADYDKIMKILCNKIGIDKISMHTLRHTFATRCIESGMKPKTLQKILGHANLSMTMDLYVHVTDEEKEKEMNKFFEMYKMT